MTDRPPLRMRFYLYEAYFNGKELELLPGRRDGRQGHSCPWTPILIVQFAIRYTISLCIQVFVCLFKPFVQAPARMTPPPPSLPLQAPDTRTLIHKPPCMCERERHICIDRDTCPSPLRMRQE